ncbi:uncharacterized protein EV420DRAFT_1639277 [Desarmillaria tabescens]|uniref:Chromo domain-containing protein n=1 Tax=Armillaria tabescens TaxID=1929756 RepID=A0AA39TQP5_ARMTA|nr:uncharacterized protein EV420DRAFT_1639277 [Desarmillaria tabescens]KAK0463168.1 hypothetical protein EV420DRAFT_1639277 [Desarmillaria tabescens]
MLIPPYCDEAENGYWYPISQPWHLQHDNHFSSSWIYKQLFDPSKKEIFCDRMLHIKTHPDAAPIRTDSLHWRPQPIPGMVKLLLGIPFVYDIDGNPDQRVTMAAGHTLESIKEMYSEIYPEVNALAQKLGQLTYGGNINNVTFGPIFQLDLKENLRSANRGPRKTTDGSFTLAVTSEQGNGIGITKPGIQCSTFEGRRQIQAVLRVLHRLYHLLMPCSVSKLEWEIMEAHYELMNVISFGGLDPNGTGCQLNSSSGEIDLHLLIGTIQGSWHTDIGDDWTKWTFLVIVFNLPPGSDPGPFFLGRLGIYIRENTWIVFLIFRGNDIHCGAHPHEGPLSDELIGGVTKCWTYTSRTNRCAYVNYPNNVATQWTGTMAMNHPTGWGNSSVHDKQEMNRKTFSDEDSIMLGNMSETKNRLAREAIMDFHDKLAQVGINLDTTKVLQMMTFTNDDGQTEHWWSWYEWYRNLCSKTFIHITKNQLHQTQRQLDFRKSSRLPAFVAVERHAVMQRSDDISDLHTRYWRVQAVVDRSFEDGKVVWFVEISGSDEIQKISNTTACLKTPNNRVLFQQFIANDILINKTPTSLEAHIPPQLEIDATVTLLFFHNNDDCDSEQVPVQQHATSAGENFQNDIWEIENILDMDFTMDTLQYLIKWRGDIPNSWVTHRDIEEYAPSALAEYRSQIGETNYLATLFDLDDDIIGSSSEHPPKRYRVDKTIQLQDTTAWASLLHLDACVAELHALVEKHESLGANKYRFHTPAFSALVEQLIEWNNAQNQYSSYMSFAGNTSNWSNISALMILQHVMNTAEILSSLNIEEYKIDLFQRALSSELSRSYIILYDWFIHMGPALAWALVRYNDMMSTEQMKSTYPILGPLVKHVTNYVRADIQKLCASGSSWQGDALGDVALIKDDLFGLCKGKGETVTLPDIHWGYHNP